VDFRKAHQQSMLFSLFAPAPRGGDVQGIDVTREAALGLDLEETGDVSVRKVRDGHVGGQSPFQRQADNTFTLAHTCGVEVIPNLASNQFRVVGKRIQRERDRNRTLDFNATIDAAQNQSLKAAAIEREAQNGGSGESA
jgi:hypothetical protein